MDQTFSRPIYHKGSDADGYLLARSTRVEAITVNPAGGDTTATFTDGVGGQILWKMEADSASGASNISFGNYPLLFKNGLYLIFDNGGDNNSSVSVAVVEPMSSGT